MQRGNMKPSSFKFANPKNLHEALELYADDSCDSIIIAGGQSLMPMMNFRLAQPELLIDINGIEELTGISESEGEITIGSMTRYVELERSDIINKHVPLITMALPYIAHSAIRNRGTIGGSMALADPAAELPAIMLTLDADITAVSRSGERSISAREFFLGLFETNLDDDEIIKAITIPKPASKQRFAFHELTRRHGDYALVGIFATALSNDPLADPRVTYFGINDRPVRAQMVEQVLEGFQVGDTDKLGNIVKAAGEMEFVGDLHASSDMKRHLAKVLLGRAITELVT
jgi:carbon-monoxide dehydrogenase medium subunit